MPVNIQIYDTTLRDGAQAQGISFSPEDKKDILIKLDEFGADFVEGGWPGSNPKDADYFREVRRLTDHRQEPYYHLPRTENFLVARP